MKKLNSIVKTIAALSIMGALFFSCSMYDPDKDGTLVIKLPGPDSARAVSSDARQYRIACGNGTEEAIRVASSGSVSMSLSSGQWAVILTVLDNDGQNIGSSDPETVVIEGGKTKSLSIEINLDKDKYYLGPGSLMLSGQVYGGKSNNEDLNIAYRNDANVYLAGDNPPSASESWDITGGILRDYSISAPTPSNLLKNEWEKIDNIHTDITLTSNSAKVAFLNLWAKSKARNFYILSKKRTYTYQSTTVNENVHYLYVDQAVTVNTSAYELKLKQGWNAIYTKEEINNKNKTIDVRLRNPVLRWTLYFDHSEK